MDRYAWIAIGGALGAIARHQMTAAIQSRVPLGFPLGTFLVNVSGCLAMGIVATLLADRLTVHANWRFAVPIGFIGAYTTFSTFEYDTFRAMNDGAWLVGGLNVLASVVVGYIALWLGVVLARAI
ncbi:MAG TPA: fluoride efflux transporter CrcB [Vicinamibacterales bacterium]